VPRSAIILPVVLLVIGLLALTMAGFLFFVTAETAGTTAYSDAQQARLAAESGLELVTAIVRLNRHDFRSWYDVPTLFRHGLVWSEGFQRDSDPVREVGSRKEYLSSGEIIPAAWRFSVVADRPDGPDNAIRFGITPESSKLNLLTASPEQLTALITPLLADLGLQNPQDVVNAILDWRDSDSDVLPGGAENEYYNSLTPAYNAKNGPPDTVEELLLVRGVTAAVLWGEDVNRNGVLDGNEDDGDETFPYYDNADGILNRGIAPFLTVWSREPDTALDNKRRINLRAGTAVVAAQIATVFQEGELSPQTIQFITGLSGQTLAQLRSPADLYPGGFDAPAGGDPNSPGGGPPDPALLASPVTLDEMPYIMDRFSTAPPDQGDFPLVGLININTAHGRVLALIPGITPEAVGAIMDMRQKLDATAARTTAWPLVSGAVEPATFKAIAPYITTKAYQEHVEIVGYGDHSKASRRYEWVIEMIGPLAQVKYFRELTELGLAWRVDDETLTVTQ
jgi:type II secretory pathway component PulK